MSPHHPLTKIERAEYALFMHMLADRADAIARQYFRQPIGHELKADNSPVTLADQEIEMALVEQIRTHYPEHGIFGEESRRIQPDASLQWVIDPIDGTKAFIAGKPTFVTLIALCVDGRPELGLISQAIQNKRWLGGDAQPGTIDSNATLAEALIATTSIPYFSAPQAAAFKRLEQATRSTLLNHDGLAYAMLAEGELDVVLDAGMKPYDFCALVPVVEQAGGIITDWEGQPVHLGSTGHVLAAVNKTLHKDALSLLSSSGQMSGDI